MNIYNERLLRLATHLEGGKLGHDRFDFRMWTTPCGTAGCAIGECPTVFPGEWGFVSEVSGDWLATISLFPALGKNRTIIFGEELGVGPRTSGIKFFNLQSQEFNRLFLSRCGGPGAILEPDVSKEAVAMNIRAFVAERIAKEEAEKGVENGEDVAVGPQTASHRSAEAICVSSARD